MKKTTVKGTNDYLPSDAKLRDYLQNTILNVYQNSGFERIMTPTLEDIENLDKSEGGENLNLIFRILKRGDKLSKAIEQEKYHDLADIGLRYDLTLPLSRYFANNKANIMLPMKCIQIDKVYRAERPQKGRLREFVQCDIDIIGSDSITAEIELIDTTAKALLAIGIKDFKVKINDKKLLKSVLSNLGFTEDKLDGVCIIFDKIDKIGIQGVEKELTEKDFPKELIQKFVNLLNQRPFTIESMKEFSDDAETITRLQKIIQMTTDLSNGAYNVEFEFSLVRGQGYYTGTIFEIESTKFKSSIAGGGRYDNLIGKFLNESVPAIGFSIGFERIFAILKESAYEIPDQKQKIAMLYEQKDFLKALQKANEFRKEYDVVLYEKPKKTGKFLNRLKDFGCDGFYIFDQSEEISSLE